MRPEWQPRPGSIPRPILRRWAPWALALLLAAPFGAILVASHSPAPAAVPVGSLSPAATPLEQAIVSLGHGAGPAAGTSLACAATSATQAGCEAAAALPGGPGGGGGGNETATNGTWVSVTQARCCGGFAYDPILGQTILFGGGAAEALGDTWAYQNGTWSRLFISSSLSVHNYVSMTYDARDGYVLLFGGMRGGSYLAETWSFQYGVWTKLSPSASPPARIGAAMTFDTADNSVILFGGYSGSQSAGGDTFFNDTWQFAGGSWTQLAPGAAPSPRTNASMVYDPVDHYVLLFGGLSSGGVLGDTWTYRGGQWAPLALGEGATAPSPRDIAAMAWDGSAQRAVLMGGRSAGGVVGDVWTFRGGLWSPGPAGPSARGGAMMAYDGSDHTLVLFGGSAGTVNLADTWVLSDGAWSMVGAGYAPTGRTGASMAWDPSQNVVTLFGGWTGAAYLGDTWTYAGGNWTLVRATGLGPTPRSGAGLAYVETNATSGAGGLLLFGGYNGGYLGDTWLFEDHAWTQLSPSASPPARTGMVLASDGSGPLALLYGGLGSSGYLGDTWAFNGTTGTWAPVTNEESGTLDPYTPLDRAYAAAIYDLRSDAVLIFGGRDAGSYLGDTLEVTLPDAAGVSTWDSPVVSPTSPDARTNATIAWEADPPYSNAVLLGGTNGTIRQSVALSDIWTYAAGNWTRIPTPAPGGGGGGEEGGTEATSPAPRTQATAVYSPVDNYLVFFSGYNGSAILADTWVWITFLAHPYASLPTADAGVNVQFYATLFGGATPYTYSWEFGDGSTSTAASPVHAYGATVPTLYTVSFVGGEAGGNTSSFALAIAVHPEMSVSAVATPSPVDVGVPVHFAGGVTGGAPPVTMTWSYGDGGWASLGTCDYAYPAPGNYTATFWANSSGGTHAMDSVNVTVVPGPAVSLVLSHAETDVGVPVSFRALVSGGVGPHDYLWSFGDGDRLPGAAANHSYAAPGTYAVTVWANDSLAQPAVATASVLVNPRPAIEATLASPLATDVGYPVAFAATGSGGTGGLSWSWDYADGASGAGNAPSHAFAQPGTYVVQVWANDTLGVSSYANVSVSVYPLPQVVSLVADPTAVHVGEPLTLTGTVNGGVAPYSYVFTELPPGCLSTDTNAISCEPNATGTYTVTLHVTDTVGAQASRTVTFAVSAPSVEPTVLGLAPALGYLVVGLILGLVGLSVVLAYAWVRTSRRAPPPAETPAPAEGPGET